MTSEKKSEDFRMPLLSSWVGDSRRVPAISSGITGKLYGDLGDIPVSAMTTDKAGFDALWDDLCAGWGYCGTVKNGKAICVTDFIPERGLVTADQFVDWVFLGDAMEPDAHTGMWQPHKDAIKASFIKDMGGEAVDASRLRLRKQ